MRDAPLRELLGEARDEVVAARAQLLAAVLEDPVVLGEQLEQDQLLEDRGAEVEREAGADDALDELAVGADPAEAQAAPDGLADRPDGDGAAGVANGGARVRPSSPSSPIVSSTTRVVPCRDGESSVRTRSSGDIERPVGLW